MNLQTCAYTVFASHISEFVVISARPEHTVECTSKGAYYYYTTAPLLVQCSCSLYFTTNTMSWFIGADSVINTRA